MLLLKVTAFPYFKQSGNGVPLLDRAIYIFENNITFNLVLN